MEMTIKLYVLYLQRLYMKTAFLSLMKLPQVSWRTNLSSREVLK